MRNFSMQSRSVACLAALTLLFSPPVRAQQTSRSAAQPAATNAAAPAGKIAGAEANEASETNEPGDGSIKIHGHWVITVRNADGTVADSREFENSLVTSGSLNNGAQVMVALLSGDAVASLPALALVPNLGSDATTTCNAGNSCVFFTVPGGPLASVTGATVVSGLNAAVNFSPPVNVILSGNFQQPAGSSATYTGVQSFFPICIPNHFSFISQGQLTASGSISNANTGANGCSTSAILGAGDTLLFTPLTSTVITQGGVATPLTLTSNQIITIVFTLTFS